MTIESCIGRLVEIVYVDTSGKFSQRRVNLFAIRNGKARVFDLNKRGFRTLSVDRILAVLPLSSSSIKPVVTARQPT
ncbi:hypothetical protein [Cohnella silvisoli]|uniref:WYL domain-containing protein n=1 Tax=Cohnella silvisoli TaxID=2873699 RepID=A0ABV1KS99_9BACL|nr:hypothetical protein [Cohnella silvisoli]MCD9022676.1 hypothetical protein [Cohnella silvisoli]